MRTRAVNWHVALSERGRCRARGDAHWLSFGSRVRGVPAWTRAACGGIQPSGCPQSGACLSPERRRACMIAARRARRAANNRD